MFQDFHHHHIMEENLGRNGLILGMLYGLFYKNKQVKISPSVVFLNLEDCLAYNLGFGEEFLSTNNRQQTPTLLRKKVMYSFKRFIFGAGKNCQDILLKIVIQKQIGNGS